MFSPKKVTKHTIVDITKPMKFVISEEDRCAHQCDPWACVVANCMNRYPHITEAQVGASRVRFKYKGIPMRGFLPVNMRKMIQAYDRENQVMPVGIMVEIVPPVPSERIGTHIKPASKVPKDQRKKGKPARIVAHAPSTRNIFVKPPS